MGCYTDKRLYDWFGDNSTLQNMQYDIKTLEANAFLFRKSFVTELIMKAWVTCALDTKCMALEGAVLWPCCGCHRYDQAALSVISTFFYGYPKDKITKPACAFTDKEQNSILDIVRKKNFFLDLVSNINYFFSDLYYLYFYS
jgi:hypothetical protein